MSIRNNNKMKQMHPRNIYNTILDFSFLANAYPEFKRHVTLGVNGKITMNFKDPEALRALAKVLLQKDFNLDVDIPINTLIPTIPLRLNYILFIEDLLTAANIDSGVIGIDIGTGSSCIYPLLGARKNNWKMIGTDCNAVNLTYASTNVTRNQLQEHIKVIEVSGQTTLKELLDKDDLQYTFCMSNPPFFCGIHELSSQLKSKKTDRKTSNSAFSASTHEVVTQGGEVEFATKIITESHDYKNRIKIFTTMLGVKRSIQPLINMLISSVDVKSYTQTEFFQGHTTRWGLAWTFQDDISFKQASESNLPKYVKKKKPFSYSQSCRGTIDSLGIQVEELLDKLQIQYKVLNKQKFSRHYNIIAYYNTWTHNRQTHREEKRMTKIMESITPTTESSNKDETDLDATIGTSFEEISIPKVETQNILGKRKLSVSDEDIEPEQMIENKKMHVEKPKESGGSKLVEAYIHLHVEENMFTIEMDCLSDNTNRGSLHQILQYIKNHLKLV